MKRLAALLGLVLPFAAPAAALDEHSYARYDDVRIDALYLDIAVDMDAKTLHGFAEYTLDWEDPAARTLDLDTRDLAIERVAQASADGAWQGARYTLGPADRVKGRRLSIATAGQPRRVRVYYATSPNASGLQWLTPQQTLGKKHPFMFSQSQAIHARSWVPLQDTPAVRFTYRARIATPPERRAVMSADNDPAATGVGGWRFTMPQRIPSYLLAIAVGDLAYKAIGPRSGVYTEPGRLDAAAYEFADTEAMIAATEKLYGPYRWGRYDLLILPPSFPFGGMENPRLSFITPTVIAGDRSLVSLIAHELAHSWSGNLVTNANWRHLWLNEGFTTYVENRIVESVYGREQALMDLVIDQTALLLELKELPAADQRLVPDLAGRDPDDVFTDVPYTKGAWLLRTIEKRVGRAAFDPFLRKWFDDQAFRSATTDDFLAYLDAHLLAKHPSAITRAEIDEWLHRPGIPKNALLAHSNALDAVDAARAKWLAGTIDAAALPTKKWVTAEWLHFLDGLPEDIAADRLRELDAAFRLSDTGNGEIALRWFRAAIRAGYRDVRPQLEKHLVGIGRRKLIVPLYEELAKRAEDKSWALAVYAKARPGYHPIAQATVDEKLGI
jgi:aminopeptidase N